MDKMMILQLAIRSLGISDLGIRIDRDRGVIVATYKQGGDDLEKEITFEALEDMFTQGPIQAHTVATGKNLSPWA